MVLISVIIPAFNTQDYIIKAISSVVNQTFKNWELIIIDDKSTDKTYSIVKNFIDKNKLNHKIRIIKNSKNKGCYYSLNTGIKNAKGKYISWLGSDDVYHKNKLNIQKKILNKNKNTVATISLYKRNSKVKGKRRNGVCTIMFRKNIIKKIGYFDSVRFGADDEFNHRLHKIYKQKRIKMLRKVLYFAITRSNSLTTCRKTGFKKPYRKRYVNSYKRWHLKKKLYMQFPLKKRPFKVPNIML